MKNFDPIPYINRNEEECEELDLLLSEVFEFGVQVFKRCR